MTPIQKHYLKTVAAVLGMSARLVSPRRTTMAQFFRHVRRLGYSPGTIIDVGVADGTFDLYSAFPTAKFLLIEPLTEFEPALRWISSRYDAHYELVAAGATDGQGCIHVGPSVAEKHGASLALGNRVYSGWGLRPVSVRRLDQLVTEKQFPGPFMLKIDTQGTELDVLRGAEQILAQIDIVILEVSFYNFSQRQGQPLVDEVLAFMADRDFFPYDVLGGYNRPLDDALAQIDIAFVKRDGPFRRDHRFDDMARTTPLSHRVISHLRSWINV